MSELIGRNNYMEFYDEINELPENDLDEIHSNSDIELSDDEYEKRELFNCINVRTLEFTSVNSHLSAKNDNIIISVGRTNYGENRTDLKDYMYIPDNVFFREENDAFVFYIILRYGILVSLNDFYKILDDTIYKYFLIESVTYSGFKNLNGIERNLKVYDLF